jgi:2'-5' RNA ligase
LSISRLSDDLGPLESAVLVPALEVGQLVLDLRTQHDPSAAAGIPPHVTLMFPFIPPSDLSEPQINALETLVGRAEPFDFTLTRVDEFEQGVLYLAPEPASAFIDLTREIGRRFGLLPFGGEFGETPVPHLTIAVDASPEKRRQIGDRLRPALPIQLKAKEAWLMVGSNSGGWAIARKMPFRRP